MVDRVNKPDAEWKSQLTPEQYRVTREKGTERPFTGEYWNTEAEGTYRCVCCGTPLFESDTKFDAGCGWPSFYAPVAEDNVHENVDTSHGMRRPEIVCAACYAQRRPEIPDGLNPPGPSYRMYSAS